MYRTAAIVVVAAAAIAALGWFVDALYLPMILVGPIVSGIVVGARRAPRRTLVATWALAGVVVLATDWAVNDEDKVFHVVVTLFMVLTALAGYGIGSLSTRRRAATTT